MPQNPTPESFSLPAIPVGSRAALRAVQTPRFKASRLSLLTVLPQTRETAVLAPLMLSVLRRGCEGYPSLAAVNRRTDELWGSTILFRDFPFGDRKALGVTLEFVDSSFLPGKPDLLPDLLDLVRRLLFCPVLDGDGLFPAAVVEDEKRLQCDEIESLIANPRQYAFEHASSLFFEGRPAGIPAYGSVEETRAVTREALTNYWKTWRDTAYFSCFYIGAANPETVATSLAATLAPLPGTAAAPSSLLDVPPPAFADRVRTKEETLAISQGHLVLGFQTGGILWGDSRAPAVELAKEVLGGSPVSLLFMNVREKLSLCYSVSASFLNSRGALFVRCALDPANREKAEREILLQIDRLKKGDFTDEELDAARKSLIFYYRTISDNPGSMERVLFRQELTAAKETPAQSIAAFAALTRKDVTEAAKLFSLQTVYFLRGDAGEGEDDEV